MSILQNAELREILDMPPHVIPVAYLCVGYPRDGFPEEPMLQKNRRDQASALGSLLVLLALLLGLNHLHAALWGDGRTASLHRLGAAVNLLLGVGWGAVVVWRTRETSPQCLGSVGFLMKSGRNGPVCPC